MAMCENNKLKSGCLKNDTSRIYTITYLGILLDSETSPVLLGTVDRRFKLERKGRG
jgi:hypothetical protein